MEREWGRERGKEKERRIDRQTDRQTDRQAGRQTDRQIRRENDIQELGGHGHRVTVRLRMLASLLTDSLQNRIGKLITE